MRLHLAGISALGFENQISDQQALEFLKKAVAKNHIPSMIEMGLLYSIGKLVSRTGKKRLNIGLWLNNLEVKSRSQDCYQ